LRQPNPQIDKKSLDQLVLQASRYEETYTRNPQGAIQPPRPSGPPRAPNSRRGTMVAATMIVTKTTSAVGAENKAVPLGGGSPNVSAVMNLHPAVVQVTRLPETVEIRLPKALDATPATLVASLGIRQKIVAQNPVPARLRQGSPQGPSQRVETRSRQKTEPS
jgi:hypothetical protein